MSCLDCPPDCGPAPKPAQGLPCWKPGTYLGNSVVFVGGYYYRLTRTTPFTSVNFQEEFINGIWVNLIPIPASFTCTDVAACPSVVTANINASQALTAANNAQSTANTALTAANTAQSTANTALTNANNALAQLLDVQATLASLQVYRHTYFS